MQVETKLGTLAAKVGSIGGSYPYIEVFLDGELMAICEVCQSRENPEAQIVVYA